LIPNETGSEYHSTSIALVKTNLNPIHSNVFYFQGTSISISTTYFKSIDCIPYKDIMSFQINFSSNWGSPSIVSYSRQNSIDTISFFGSQLNWKAYIMSFQIM